MIRCPWCGAPNYAIDSWCSSCSRHLDWAPPPPVAAAPPPPAPAAQATLPTADVAPTRRPSTHGRRHRWLTLLAPVAAGFGIAFLLAQPVASWFSAARAPRPVLPNTAMRRAAPTPSAQSLSTPTPSAPSLSTPTPTPTTEAAPTPDANPRASPPADDSSTHDSGAQAQPPFTRTGSHPAEAVAHFYQAVAAHDFGAAAALWTTRMQARYPPAEFIDHRFSATQQISLRTERLLGAGDGVAVVYVDVIERIDGQTRHWVGTWQLVDTTSGWLLNQPNLRAA